MTVTFRKALRGTVRDCIRYIMRDDKTDYQKLVSGINCTPAFAADQMMDLYNSCDKKGRVGYHAWQAFHFEDDITPEQAHEIGVKLAEELYSDYQVVVATHVDKGHLHNHFVISSINLKTGKKLEDRLSSDEGIKKLREVSDNISLDYGLKIIEDAPAIGRYRNKNRVFDLTPNGQRKKAIADIERLLVGVDQFDLLLELLEIEGYQIKRGKFISIKSPAGTRYLRLKNLAKDDAYSERNLKTRIYQNKKDSFLSENKKPYTVYKGMLPTNQKNSINKSNIDKLALELGVEKSKIEAMLNKQDAIVRANKKEKFNGYQKRRYIIKRNMNELTKIFNILNKEKINSKEDLILVQAGYEFDLDDMEKEYQLEKSELNKLIMILRVIEVYKQYYSLHEIMEEEKGFVTKSINENYAKELKCFEEAKSQLKRHCPANSINDVNKLAAMINGKKKMLTEKLVKISDVKSNIRDLNTLKEFYFKNKKENIDLYNVVEIDRNQIINETANKTLLQLSDKQFVYLNPEAIFNIKNKTGIYLMEDLEYVILDEKLEEKERVNADELKQRTQNNNSYNKSREEKRKGL